MGQPNIAQPSCWNERTVAYLGAIDYVERWNSAAEASSNVPSTVKCSSEIRCATTRTASAGAIKGDETSAGDIAARVDALRHLLREVGHAV